MDRDTHREPASLRTYIDEENAIWRGGNEGVFKVVDRDTHREPASLRTYIDEENVIWRGGNEGVFKVACRRFRYSKTAEGKPQLGKDTLGGGLLGGMLRTPKTNDVEHFVQDKISLSSTFCTGFV